MAFKARYKKPLTVIKMEIVIRIGPNHGFEINHFYLKRSDYCVNIGKPREY